MNETPTPPVMPAARAARLLADILKWRLQHEPQYQTVRAVRYDHDAPATTGDRGLPFGLDRIIDTTTTDGPTGITTSEGVDRWLTFWQPWFNHWTNTSTVRSQPGAFYLQALENDSVFQTVADWDEGNADAWQEFTQELTTVWTMLRTTTGHAPLNRGLCPHCKTGNLHSHPTRHGYTDHATCTNPDCTTRIDYSHAEIQASMRAALRDPSIDPGYHVTIEDVKTIWPRINTSTLRSRVADGHVRKRGDKYNLADINTWQWDKHLL